MWARAGFGEMAPGNASVAGAVAGIVVVQMVIAAYVLVAYHETTALAEGKAEATHERTAGGDEAPHEDKKER